MIALTSVVVAGTFLGGCATGLDASTAAPQGAATFAPETAVCETGYRQLPRCECGCIGGLCSSAAAGVMLCEAERDGVRRVLGPGN